MSEKGKIERQNPRDSSRVIHVVMVTPWGAPCACHPRATSTPTSNRGWYRSKRRRRRRRRWWRRCRIPTERYWQQDLVYLPLFYLILYQLLFSLLSLSYIYFFFSHSFFYHHVLFVPLSCLSFCVNSHIYLFTKIFFLFIFCNYFLFLNFISVWSIVHCFSHIDFLSAVDKKTEMRLAKKLTRMQS